MTSVGTFCSKVSCTVSLASPKCCNFNETVETGQVESMLVVATLTIKI